MPFSAGFTAAGFAGGADFGAAALAIGLVAVAAFDLFLFAGREAFAADFVATAFTTFLTGLDFCLLFAFLAGAFFFNGLDFFAVAFFAGFLVGFFDAMAWVGLPLRG